MEKPNKHYKARVYVRKLLNQSGFPKNKWFVARSKNGTLVVRLTKSKYD